MRAWHCLSLRLWQFVIILLDQWLYLLVRKWFVGLVVFTLKRVLRTAVAFADWWQETLPCTRFVGRFSSPCSIVETPSDNQTHRWYLSSKMFICNTSRYRDAVAWAWALSVFNALRSVHVSESPCTTLLFYLKRFAATLCRGCWLLFPCVSTVVVYCVMSVSMCVYVWSVSMCVYLLECVFCCVVCSLGVVHAYYVVCVSVRGCMCGCVCLCVDEFVVSLYLSLQQLFAFVTLVWFTIVEIVLGEICRRIWTIAAFRNISHTTRQYLRGR